MQLEKQLFPINVTEFNNFTFWSEAQFEKHSKPIYLTEDGTFTLFKDEHE
jgi:hypothetical protein